MRGGEEGETAAHSLPKGKERIDYRRFVRERGSRDPLRQKRSRGGELELRRSTSERAETHLLGKNGSPRCAAGKREKRWSRQRKKVELQRTLPETGNKEEDTSVKEKSDCQAHMGTKNLEDRSTSVRGLMGGRGNLVPRKI